MSETLPALVGTVLPFDRARLAPEEAECAEEIADELARIYSSTLAETEDPERPGDPTGYAFDPAEETLQYFLDTYAWDVEPDAEAVAAWAEAHAEEIERELPFARIRIRQGRLADAYHDLRRQGKTTIEIARKLGATPVEITQALKSQRFEEEDRTQATRITLHAQNEHEKHRATCARRRLLGTISAKLEREFKARDLSDIPSKDLAHLLVKLAEVSREEPPPRLAVKPAPSSLL